MAEVVYLQLNVLCHSKGIEDIGTFLDSKGIIAL